MTGGTGWREGDEHGSEEEEDDEEDYEEESEGDEEAGEGDGQGTNAAGPSTAPPARGNTTNDGKSGPSSSSHSSNTKNGPQQVRSRYARRKLESNAWRFEHPSDEEDPNAEEKEPGESWPTGTRS